MVQRASNELPFCRQCISKRTSNRTMSADESSMDGATILAHSLKRQGVKYMFGVVGVPIIEVAFAAQAAGIKYIGMRNEQAASHAASVVGYMTSRPGVCLVVSGPGLVNALAGMANAKENGWPLIVIGGSSDTYQDGMGAFQEFPQVDYSRPLCNYSCRPDSIARIPVLLEKAVRMATFGRPGVSYFDIPGDYVNGKGSDVHLSSLPGPVQPPRSQALQEDVVRTLQVLYQAKRPLVIIGKGVLIDAYDMKLDCIAQLSPELFFKLVIQSAAHSRAESELLKFINTCRIPFLPTPMGKGVVPDKHELCVIAARSRALKRADTILLIGARLNWILHFGLPPRFAEDVKIMQIDHNCSEFGNNRESEVALHGDIKAVMKQFNDELSTNYRGSFPENGEWRNELQEKIKMNTITLEAQSKDDTLPMNFYRVYEELNKVLPSDAIIINEGANTMDIGRTMMANSLPRHRLDAGTFGTMGVGTGFAIAAALIAEDPQSEYYGQKVFCIQGDSAFGFSGMEVETAVRYKLPIIFMVINNNGIYSGVTEEAWSEIVSGESDLPTAVLPTSLLPSARYEKIIEAFGCPGYFAYTPNQVHEAVTSALQETERPSLIHVAVNPISGRKAQEFDWLTKSSL